MKRKSNIWLALFLMLALPASQAFAAKKKSTDTTTTKRAPASPVDLNTASESELVAIPGIGSSTAKKIMAGRPYSSVSDLSKAGIAKTTIAKIQPNVMVSGAAASRPAPVPAATSKVTPAPSSSTPTTTRASRSTAASTAASAPQPAPPAGSGQVWVNLETKVYHKEGDRWYGKTKKGKYMVEADAIKAGYRLAK